MDLNYFNKVRILDGGMGQELLSNGLISKGTLWSSTALLEKKYHKLVVDTHLSFINAGADVIITNKNSDREDFKKTIDSITAAGKPHYIIVANWSDLSHPEVVVNTKILLDESEIDYKVVNVHEDEITDLEIIDHAFIYVKNGFYSVIEAGKEIKPDIQQILSHAINDQFKTVGFVDGYDGVNGLTAQAVIHKHLFGNYDKTLREKIEGISGDEGTKILYSWEELENDTA